MGILTGLTEKGDMYAITDLARCLEDDPSEDNSRLVVSDGVKTVAGEALMAAAERGNKHPIHAVAACIEANMDSINPCALGVLVRLANKSDTRQAAEAVECLSEC